MALVLVLEACAVEVLADKDAFMTGVVTGSHEFRLSKIDQKVRGIGWP